MEIAPYRENRGLVPAKDIEEARKAFERPAREITISEIYSYYGTYGFRPLADKETKALVPALTAKLPSLLNRYNTLEADRQRSGFDKTRAEVEKAIRSMISYDEGYHRLTEAQKRFDIDYVVGKMLSEYLGKRKFDINEDDERLNMAMSLTSEEIAWVSVLNRLPRTVFDHKLSNVPAIVDRFYDGVEWALDSMSNKEREVPRDTFNLLGVTGAREDVEFCPFNPKMKAALQGLYLGWIADGYIFDRCLDELGSGAVISGDAKLLRTLATREGKIFDDRYALESRGKVNEFLSSLKVIYAMDREIWSGERLIKLIGALEAVPNCFFERRIVAFIASGKGIMFLDPVTVEEIEYVRFDPYVAHVAETEIHYSAQAIDRGNPIWSFIFSNVSMWIAEKNSKEGKVSKLDAMAAKIKKDYGVEVILGVEKKFRDVVLASVGDVTPFDYTIKIGYWDMYNADFVFSKLPRWHLEGVKTLRRSAYGNSWKEVMTGTQHRGSYYIKEKTLELYIPGCNDPDNRDEMPENVPGHDSIMYSMTITHETGHAVYFENPWIQKEWDGISDARDSYPPKKRASRFLTAYSSTDKHEDFAEHYACYLLFGDQFRDSAAKHPEIMRKYEFMKKVFDDIEHPPITKADLRMIRGPIEFDYALRRRLLEKDADLMMVESTSAASIETLRIEEQKNERDRNKAIKGPRIFSLDVVDDPSKMKAPDPRDFIEENPFDVVNAVRNIFESEFGPYGYFVDPVFTSLRLSSGDMESVILDVANSTGLERNVVRPVVEKCGVALKKLLDRIESAKEAEKKAEAEEPREDHNYFDEDDRDRGDSGEEE
jgi:hypothetical protein